MVDLRFEMTSKPAGKRLVKSKSGLKMVCQHDRESAPWDMAEPPWVPDEEVWMAHILNLSNLEILSLVKQ